MRMKRISRLPLEPCNVSVELVREIEDQDTGEVVDEHIIDVFGRFFPEEQGVGLGAFIEVIEAKLVGDAGAVSVELEDWEVDTLVDLLQEQRRT